MLRRGIAVVLVCLICAARVMAQCEAGWLPGNGVPGTDGGVSDSTLWDPDGPGPQTPKVVIAGSFRVAGNISANGIALYDPDTGQWSSFGSGANSNVSTVEVLPNGDLIAGGGFTTIDGVSANHIARWDGTSWHPMGPGLIGPGGSGGVLDLAVLPSGDLVAGGLFLYSGATSVRGIARWDGTTWSSLGSGMDGNAANPPDVYALAVLPNGDLIAGGSFAAAGGVTAYKVARWNGSSWSPLGSGFDSTIYVLKVMPNGELLAGGQATRSGLTNLNGLSRWTGTSWTPFSSGPFTFVTLLEVLPNGHLIAGGGFSSAWGIEAACIARWDGTAWSPLGFGTEGGVSALTVLPNGDMIVGGGFTNPGGVAATGVARWDGATWSPLGTELGATGRGKALMVRSNGDLIAGGEFASIDGVAVHGIARWSDAMWSAFGSGVGGDSLSGLIGPNPHVHALASMPNGDVIAGGRFDSAGGLAAQGIARWDGTSWSPLGAGVGGTNPYVYALAVLPNGDLIAGGTFTTAGGISATGIARWDGTTWSPLGSGMRFGNQSVHALLVLPNGDLIAGGGFNRAGDAAAYGIARWDGVEWTALGSWPVASGSSVYALAVMPNGDVVAGGTFTQMMGVSANRIARWNGSAWAPLGSGIEHGRSGRITIVSALTVLPNGDLLAGGHFLTAGGQPATGIALWNGASWSSLGSELNGVNDYFSVNALCVLPNQQVLASGSFSTIGGNVSAYFARYTFGEPGCECPGCPADYDQDGGVTGADIGAFFVDFEQGEACADVDLDGGVTGADIGAFFLAYEAGGC